MNIKFVRWTVFLLGFFVLAGCAETNQTNQNPKETGETKIEDTANQKQAINEPQEEKQDQVEADQPLAQAVESITQEPQNEANQIVESQPASPSEDSKTEGQSPQKLYKIIKVVDGDTVAVDIDGTKETLRLIGINTPETVDPRKPVECFGKEASNKAKEVLNGKSVILESDPIQGERDKYGRLLRYIFLEDGTNFNKLMIAEGYAYEYTYNFPYKYQEEFKQAEKEARENKRGLWADDACVAQQSPQLTPPVQPPLTTTTAICDCSGNIHNCPDFKTQDEAQNCYNYCEQLGKGDIHKLDADKDGVVCETLP